MKFTKHSVALVYVSTHLDLDPNNLLYSIKLGFFNHNQSKL